MRTLLLSANLLLFVMSSAQDSLHINRSAFLYGLIAYDFPRSYGFMIGGSIPFHSILKKKKIKNLSPGTLRKTSFFLLNQAGIVIRLPIRQSW